VKVAVTVLLWFMVTVQVFPLVLSHPDQLASEELIQGVAVSVTEAPLM
jgi:hypothetical protein